MMVELKFSKDLVYFRASTIGVYLLLNPELGTWATVNSSEFMDLKTLIQSGKLSNDYILVERSFDDLATSPLRRLIIRRIAYYGAFKPNIDESMPSIPPFLYWETTHGCSLRCRYCYMRADKVLPDELSTEEAKSLITQAATLGVKSFVFTGGEPLLRRDIFELGNYAKQVGLSPQIITNATLIVSLDVARKVRDTFDEVTTSLDGPTPESNDTHRGAGSFEKIVRGIKYLNAVGVKPGINATISEANVEYVEELIKFTRSELQVKGLRLVNVAFLGRAKGSSLSYLWSTYKKTFEAIRKSGEGSLQETQRPKIWQIRPRKFCGMGTGEIYVDSRGNVYPCKLVTTPEWRAGNIRERPLKEILLNSPALQRAHNLSITKQLGCRTCIIRRLCGGGCRGMHMGYTGDPLVNAPQFCWILRHQRIAYLWSLEGLSHALQDQEAMIPYRLLDDEVWQPELGTALPESELKDTSLLKASDCHERHLVP
jgi:radical SAM protein with 4Fe4S-binding SPASM domain